MKRDGVAHIDAGKAGIALDLACIRPQHAGAGRVATTAGVGSAQVLVGVL